MELTNETPIEQVETEEQKSKRRVPKYFLLHLNQAFEYFEYKTFENKKELKEFLETNDLQEKCPIVILGHEVPLQFNKVVKVDF